MEQRDDNVTVWWCEDFGVRIIASINDNWDVLDWFDDRSKSDTRRVVDAVWYVRSNWAPGRGLFAVAWPEFVDEAQRRAEEHGAGKGHLDNWICMPLERAVTEADVEDEDGQG